VTYKVTLRMRLCVPPARQARVRDDDLDVQRMDNEIEALRVCRFEREPDTGHEDDGDSKRSLLPQEPPQAYRRISVRNFTERRGRDPILFPEANFHAET
jgi:hypothetical protein